MTCHQLAARLRKSALYLLFVVAIHAVTIYSFFHALKLKASPEISLSHEIDIERELEFAAMTAKEVKQGGGITHNDARLQELAKASALVQKYHQDVHKASLQAYMLLIFAITVTNMYSENDFAASFLIVIVSMLSFIDAIPLYGPSISHWLHQSFLGYHIGQVLVSCLAAIVLLGAIWWDFIRCKTTGGAVS